MTDADRPTSRNIPLPIQRLVRQRCGFGCVVCGLPLYEYDHLLGWAQVQRHVAEEITLLCDLHHREKTSGLLTTDAVVKANSEPFNLRAGVSRPYDLHFDGTSCDVEIGSNRFGIAIPTGDGLLIPLSIDGVPLLAFLLQDGHLLLNLVVFDEFNQLVLHIKNNQLFYSMSPWDIQFVGRQIIVREAARKILVDIVFDVPSAVKIQRARLMFNGVEIAVWPDRLVLINNGMIYSGGSMTNIPIGFAIGRHEPPVRAAGFLMTHVPRYFHDRTVSDRWIEEEFSVKEPA